MKFIKNSLMYVVIILLPKNIASHLMGRLVSLSVPTSLALFINKLFARLVGINIAEAEKPLEAYENLQQFFIRRLKPNLRPIAQEAEAIISPCDGFLAESGAITDGIITQVKGRYYSVNDLLGCRERARRFEGGYFATIYLSPRDYHRFHAPVSGVVSETIYIPGSLWPVNPWAVAHIKNLFCVNERIISFIVPDGQKKLVAQIAVGATMVGKIKLNYCGLESNSFGDKTIIEHHNSPSVHVEKGEEFGQFMFGSTIIMLFEAGLINEFVPEKPVALKMGEKIAIMSTEEMRESLRDR